MGNKPDMRGRGREGGREWGEGGEEASIQLGDENPGSAVYPRPHGFASVSITVAS